MRIAATFVFAAATFVLSACAQPPAFKEYPYPAWGFAASFRAPPKETDTPASADGTSVHTFLVESALAGRDDLVNVIDGSGSSKSEDEALSDAPGTLAKSVNGTVGSMTYTASGAVVGREFLISRPDHPTARARVFVSNKHLYEIVSQSSLGPDDPQVTTFLNSFRLLPAP